MTLVGAAARTLAWRTVVGAVGVAMVAAWLDAPLLAGAALALGAAGAFDEPAAAIVIAAPTSLARLRASRLAVCLPVLALGWVATSTVDGPAALPTVALVTLALAAAAVALRYRPASPGAVVAGPAVMVAVLAGDRILTSDTRWLALAVGSLALLWLASSNTLAFSRRIQPSERESVGGCETVGSA